MRGQLARRLRLGLALYVAMIALAVTIAWWRDDSLLVQPVDAPAWMPAALATSAFAPQLGSAALGVLLATVTLASTELLVRRTQWARALRAEFRAALEGARSGDLVALAVASGSAEELLFRGALQPWLGLWVTSLLFGAVHFVPSRALLPWTIWAGVMGLLLGLVYQHTGSIAGPVIAHIGINAINLHRIARFDPSLDEDDPHAPPSLVPRKRTRSGG
ncbi:MAG: CPBP family intramembrane metalloprotease [Sandaracinaceae bacterium]|nr:CPBP family intramembrane metalloprotease [Sandaracinaceae bacterium]